MDSDQDLIIKYQILLENEKRRLAVANFNPTEKNEFEITEFQPSTECSDPKIGINNTKSPQKSTNVLTKEEIVPIVPKSTECEIHSNKQQVWPSIAK